MWYNKSDVTWDNFRGYQQLVDLTNQRYFDKLIAKG